MNYLYRSSTKQCETNKNSEIIFQNVEEQRDEENKDENNAHGR